MPTPEQQAYNRFVENRRIEMSVKETATYEGFQDGMEKGFDKGLEKGFEKGLEKVEEKIKDRNFDITKKLLQKNIDKEVIMASTGLSMEEIEALEKEL